MIRIELVQYLGCQADTFCIIYTDIENETDAKQEVFSYSYGETIRCIIHFKYTSREI